jgi:hypothetical protein
LIMFSTFFDDLLATRNGSGSMAQARTAYTRYPPDGLGRHSKPCSSAGPRSTGRYVRRRTSGERNRCTPARRRIRATLVPAVDLGAWFSPRLRPPSCFAPVRPPQRPALASDRSGAGSRVMGGLVTASRVGRF